MLFSPSGGMAVRLMRLPVSLLLVLVRNSWGDSRVSGKTFVHLFEWSWADIALECEEFLGPKGYAAVQISPPNEHVNQSGWMARYQPVTYKLESRSGTRAQLQDMIQRCRAAGVSVYADVVINQMAPHGGVGIAGSLYTDRTYPNYGPEDMHHLPGEPSTNCGVNRDEDRHNIQYCDLLGMPDLCTGCSHVQAVVTQYIADLKSLGIDGICIDAAKHQNATELGQILSRIDAKLFRFLEVLKEPGEPVQPEEYLSLGQVTEARYGGALAHMFKAPGGFAPDLSGFGEALSLMPGGQAIVFLDSHDTQRKATAFTHKDGAVYTMAMVYMLAWPYGYPRVMSSYAFDDVHDGPPASPAHGSPLQCGPGEPWVCEHRQPAIANMVAWRRVAGDADVTLFATPNNSTMAFCRGAVACVAFNRNEVDPWEATLELTVPPGMYCDVSQSDDSRSCPTVIVSAHAGGLSVAHVTVPPLGVVALHVGALHGMQQDKGLLAISRRHAMQESSSRRVDQEYIFRFCCAMCMLLLIASYGMSDGLCRWFELEADVNESVVKGPLLHA